MPETAVLETLIPQVAATCDRAADYILATADCTRRDRLWPAHHLVFATNPLSLAYGAAGIAHVLHQLRGELPAEVRQWLLERRVTEDDYPPGLYVGAAGVAWAFAGMGLEERAEEVMEAAYRSPLLEAEGGMFLGSAGWGLASLALHARTGRERYLDRAVQAGKHLLRTAVREDGTCHWPYHADGRVHFGYGYGASGVAIFLLELWARTGDDRYLATARGGLDYDLAHRRDTPDGVAWVRYVDDFVSLPYWLHGSTGVGRAAIRLWHRTGEERYRAAAEEIAEGASYKWAVLPCLLEGLAGLGDYMVDMHRFTGEERWRERALDIAETVLWFGVERPEGTAFPGRWLSRISNDYATGGAGIASFLHRVARGGPRAFLDLEGGA
jgi:hypothetical protein